MSIRSDRKEEHLALAQMFFNNKKHNSFDKMHLLRPALPESEVNLANIQTTMFNKKIAAPFFINAMTGGSKKSYQINKELGKIANNTKIAMALGSASILAKEAPQIDSFYVAREQNPDGVIIANVNPKTPAKITAKIINDIKADALQIHLNTIQEIAMPEGDRNFYWLDNILAIKELIDVPIIIKEVGFGLDQTTIRQLKKVGFDWFDIAGQGGTNFAEIENKRNDQDVSYLKEIGLPTVISALMAKKEDVNFIVSGGVRNPLDVLKGLVLGGKYIGISNTFLHALTNNGQDYLQTLIDNWKNELAALLAVFSVPNLTTVTKVKPYYDLELKNYIDQLI